MAEDDATGAGPGQAGRSRPRAGAGPELLEREEPDAAVGPRGRAGGLGVVAPRGEVEADVVQVGMRRHVLQGLEPVLDESQARPAAVLGRPSPDERAQVLALVHAGLLALDVREADVPMVEDAPR